MIAVCFTCGKEYFSLATPMRCAECVKNKVQIQTSPVRDCFWVLTTEPCQIESNLCQVDEKINSEKQNE